MTPEFADSIQYDPATSVPGQEVDASSSEASEPAAPAVLVPEVITELPVQAVATQIGDVAVDTVKLLDLQLRLFESELASSAKQLVQPILQIAASAVLGTASLIVLLIAVSAGLQQFFHLSAALSLFSVAVAGFAVTAVAAQVARKQLMVPRISFAKSKVELMRNAEMLAQLLNPTR